MYKRDATAEMKETLERLSIAVDKFAEVHAKDRDAKEDSGRELLEFLKKGGAREVKEVPAADMRADQLMRQPGGRRGLGTFADQTINFSTFFRLQTAVRALSGDFTAFQRTIFNTMAYANRAHAVAERVNAAASTTAAQVITKATKTTFRRATDDEIAQAMKDAAAKGLSGEAMMAVAADLAKKGVPVEGAAAQRATEIVKAGRGGGGAGQVKSTMQGTLGGAVASGVRGVTTMSMATLVQAGVAVAAVAAPIVLARMINRGTEQQIKDKRPLSRLEGGLALAYAQYDVNTLMTSLRHAQGIRDSMTQLLKDRAAFDRTIEPIQTLTDNVKNNILAFGNRVQSSFLKPFSMLADEANRTKPFWDKMTEVGKEVLFNQIQSIFPAAAPLRFFHEKMQELIDAQAGKAGIPLMDFTKQIARKVNVCPPQRFVP